MARDSNRPYCLTYVWKKKKKKMKKKKKKKKMMMMMMMMIVCFRHIILYTLHKQRSRLTL